MKNTNKKRCSGACLSLALLLVLLSCSTKEVQPPNVMIIFPDQFRQYSLGFWSQPGNAKYLQGSPDPVVTPALDKLANESIVFSRSVSNFPLCSPYRGMLLSGMYPTKNGLTTNCRSDREEQLRQDAECITDVYAKAGYNVSYFGKCHWQRTEPLFDEQGTFIGSAKTPGGHYINRYDTYVPPGKSRHSIDYFFQALKDDHFNPMVYSSDPVANDGKQDGELNRPGVFSSKLESEKIMDYLSNSHGQRDPNKPFLMIWSLNPPHNPWTENSTYMEFFPQYTADGDIRLDKLLTHANADSAIGHYAPYYFANVSAVDHFIGKVLDHLEVLGLTDNTIVIFSSDHGEMLGSHGLQGKNVPEIEALSIPFMIKWSNHIQPRVEDLILSVPDIMPTVLGLSGMASMIPDEVQGNNYASILTGSAKSDLGKPSSALYLGVHSRGVYTGRYTFVVKEQDNELSEAFYYDNEQDPEQLTRILWDQTDPGMQSFFKNELLRLLKETEDSWINDNVCSTFFQSS